MIRTISYDFSGLQTQIVGDGSITVIEQDAIYWGINVNNDSR